MGHNKQRREGKSLTPLRNMGVRRPVAADPIEWFLSWFDTSGGPDACHEWRRARTTDEYGVDYGTLAEIYGSARTHVIKWVMVNGPVPDGLQVRHLVCDNPPCGNVAHLALGTPRDNTDDMLRKGRQLRGERVNTARLTEDAVRDIRRRLAAGEAQGRVAALYGVQRPAINKIHLGKTWRHVV